MSVSITLQGMLYLTDSVVGTVPMRKQIKLVMNGTAMDEAQGLVVGTSPLTIPLPISPTQWVYIGNLSTANTVTVTWTPTGGGSAIVQTIQPATATSAGAGMASSGILICNSNGVGASGTGITALSVVASGAATAIEYVLGG